jgi:hypothetical protein
VLSRLGEVCVLGLALSFLIGWEIILYLSALLFVFLWLTEPRKMLFITLSPILIKYKENEKVRTFGKKLCN